MPCSTGAHSPQEWVFGNHNLNGDYISDALAAKSSSGIAPGANIGFDAGIAIAGRGTLPSTPARQGQPRQPVLSAEMMFVHGLDRGADLVVKGMEGAIPARTMPRL